jgi:hypothetical protein
LYPKMYRKHLSFKYYATLMSFALAMLNSTIGCRG